MKEKPRIRKMKRNLRLYYAFRVLACMHFVMPIFMLFLIDKGLSSFEIMITQAAYTLMELFLTVPSGAFADKVGRKMTLILSSALYSVCFALYGFAGTFTHVLLIELLFAVSSAAFHGTGEAFLYDTLAEAGRTKRYNKVVGTAYAIQSVMMGAAAVAGGWLASFDLSWPFFASALPTGLALVPLFFLDEPVRKSRPEEGYWKLMKGATAYAAKHSVIRNVMYFLGVSSLAGFTGWMFFQPMLTKMGMSIRYLGVVMMFLSVANGVGSKLAHSFEKRLGSRHFLLFFAASKALLYLLIYLATGYYLLVWAFVLDFVGGLMRPALTDWVSRHSTEDKRATILSLVSMSECLTFSLFSPLLGLYVDAYSEQQVYLLLALMLIAYSVRQLLLLLWALKAGRKPRRL